MWGGERRELRRQSRERSREWRRMHGEEDARAGRVGNEGGEAIEGDSKQDDGGTDLEDGGREKGKLEG